MAKYKPKSAWKATIDWLETDKFWPKPGRLVMVLGGAQARFAYRDERGNWRNKAGGYMNAAPQFYAECPALPDNLSRAGKH